MKKKRLHVTLSPEVWDRLRTEMFRKDERANHLIEQALKKHLPKGAFAYSTVEDKAKVSR